MNSTELKSRDDGVNLTYPAGLSWHIRSLNTIEIGYQSNQRIGREIRLVRLDCKGWIRREYNQGGILGPDTFRMGIVYDKQGNGTGPNIEELLTPSLLVDRDTNLVNSMPNLANEDRFIWLHDKRYTFNWCDTTASVDETAQDSPSQHLVDFSINLGRLPCIYRNDAAVPPLTGNLLYFFTGTGPASQDGYSFQNMFRLFYTD